VAPDDPTVDRELQQVQAKIEHCCGVAMSHERIAEQLTLLLRWERGRFTTHEQSRNLREALSEYRRLKARAGPRVALAS
jgi:hypothetical protein